MEKLEDFYGRRLPAYQISSDYLSHGKLMPALSEDRGKFVCQRCGQRIEEDWFLPTGNHYCRSCIVFGRLTSADQLCYFSQEPFAPTNSLNWSGRLTPYQEEVSQGLLKGLGEGLNMLVHAVTGAGKTEMIYQVVAQVLDRGGCVGIASPRIDVCLELYERFKRDFSCPICLLHGQSEPYHRAPFVVATTHQLLRFYRAFDLLIIDEVDAFPFVDNAALYYAVEQAVKTDGVKIYLTATSTDSLDKQVAKGELTKLHLARRFHANPLVIPKPVWQPVLRAKVAKGRLPKALIKRIAAQRQTGYPLLLFYPNIKEGEQFTKLLRNYFPKETIGFVSSQTEDRLEQVTAFRRAELSMLVTTTILERGVTFPCVDVFVLEAHHFLYTRSSLVQIAGRVGRAKERPTGELIFFHRGQTKAIKAAIAEIKAMNQKGGFT